MNARHWPAHDKEASARFLARILGLRYEGALSHFAPLRVNDTLTLDFDNDTTYSTMQYNFSHDNDGADNDDAQPSIGAGIDQRGGV